MLSITNKPFMLNVIMLSVVAPNNKDNHVASCVGRQDAVLLNVVEPFSKLFLWKGRFKKLLLKLHLPLLARKVHWT